MTCDIITRINDIEAAYLALRDRCAPSATPPSGQNCIVPYLEELVGLARAVAADPANQITELLPEPSFAPCLTDDYLLAVLAWINGMTCEEGTGGVVGGYRYEQTIWYVSWAEALSYWDISMVANGVAGMDGVFGHTGGGGIIIDQGFFLTQSPVSARLTGVYSIPEDGDWTPYFDATSSWWLALLYRSIKVETGFGALGWEWQPDPAWDSSIWWVSNHPTFTEANPAPGGFPGNYPIIGTRSSGSNWTQWDFELPEGYIVEP